MNPCNPRQIFIQAFTLLQRIPALGAQFELLVVAADEHQAELGARDVTDKLHVVQLLNLLVVAYGNGEEQFVILAAVQGAGGDVHVQLFGHHSRLIVYG